MTPRRYASPHLPDDAVSGALVGGHPHEAGRRPARRDPGFSEGHQPRPSPVIQLGSDDGRGWFEPEGTIMGQAIEVDNRGESEIALNLGDLDVEAVKAAGDGEMGPAPVLTLRPRPDQFADVRAPLSEPRSRLRDGPSRDQPGARSGPGLPPPVVPTPEPPVARSGASSSPCRMADVALDAVAAGPGLDELRCRLAGGGAGVATPPFSRSCWSC